MAKFCKSCGAQLSENAAFCTSCGVSADSPLQKPANPPDPVEKISKTLNMNSKLGAFSAAAVPGEFSVGNVIPLSGLSVPGLDQIKGPFKYLGSSFIGIIKGIKGVFKNKKLLIPVIVLAVTWLVLNLLPALGVDGTPVRVLSFLTFAKGGTTGGALGIIGGLAGKSVFAYFITSMVIPIFTRKKKEKSDNKSGASKSGVSQFFSSLGESFGNIALLPSLLSGCAVALLLYNFMTGDNSIQDAMAGIAALLLSIR
ncbi:MAG: zinc ribbon domain-containing protein, partial [Clostridia bacterium]|nr:zinc ribbon domain-containing protein [Clostridia bacterium]